MADTLAALLPQGADHPLFDGAWYEAQHPEVAIAGLDPFAHFSERGSATGCRPNPLFDPVWYLSRYPEVAAAGLDPFVHYLREGEATGYRPNPLLHTEWLRTQHPELADPSSSPLAYYLTRARDDAPARPNPLFDPAWYRARHGLASGADALAHLLEVGSAAGLSPHPLFDAAYYEAQNPGLGGAVPLAHFLDIGAAAGCSPHLLFDVDWYRERNLGGDASVDPLVHFVEEGAAAGLSPHPFFDLAWYRDRYARVRASGVNPLVHYLEVGIAEDREPNPVFDPVWYRAQHPELAASGEPPLYHYLAHGHEPGHPPSPRFDAYAPFFRDGPGPPEVSIEADPQNPLRDYLDRGLAPSAAQPPALALPEPETPLVSIVIPVFNQLPHTVACLRSLAAVRCNVPFEVIVADDASDAVLYPEVLGNVAGVHVLRAETNRGFVRTCNAGAAQARGRFVLFLNNDTTVCDDWLDEGVATFSRFSDVGVVGSKTIFPNGRVAEAGGIVWRDGSAWNFGRQRDPADPEVDYARPADYVSGAALMVDRSLWDELGGFDERFCPAYYEDTDLAFRARAAGRRVVYQACSELLHFEGTSQGTSVESGVKSHQRINQTSFFDRWRDTLAAHRPPGEEPTAEKDRGLAGEALVVDVCLPSSSRDARSQRLLGMLKALRDLGYRVTFVPENGDAGPPFGPQLRGCGIRVLGPPWIDSLDAYLAEEGERFDLCLAARPATASRQLALLRRRCPRARILTDGSDLMDPTTVARLLDGGAAEAALPAIVTGADATLIATGGPAGPPAGGRDDVHVIPRFFETAGEAPGFDARHDVLVITGLQRPPLVDALLWLRDEILPALDEGLADVRFFVRDDELVRGLGVTGGRLVALPERSLLDPHGLDRFRLAVVPLRFGAGATGPAQAALARGLPCVATTRGAAGLAAALDGALRLADTAADFADAAARLYQDERAWQAAAVAARRGMDALFSASDARRALARAAGLEAR